MTKIVHTHYATYLRERQNALILEDEHGFIIYRLVGDECFIVDMFIEKEKRGNGHLKTMIAALDDLATFEGAKYISACIYLKDPHASNTLRSALKIGFIVAKAEFGALHIAKLIGGI